jgi:hypothetical protein
VKSSEPFTIRHQRPAETQVFVFLEKEVEMKVPVNLAAIMASPTMSVSTSPFAPDMAIIKRASFIKGEVPKHLEKYLIRKGECAGRTGTVVYHGAKIPAAAVCVAEKRGGRAVRRAKKSEE